VSLSPRMIVVVTTLVLFSGTLRSQIENLQDTWRWTTFSTESGLPSNAVYDVLETQNGVVWASTARGLAWYDGYFWHAVGADQGLPAEQITLLMADRDTSVLVIMGRRLFTGNRDHFAEIAVDQDTTRTPFTSGAVLPTGRSLLLTSDGTAYVRDGELLLPAPRMNTSTHTTITSIAAQPSGRILVNTSHGLFAGDGREWTCVLGFGEEVLELAHFAENARKDGAAWVQHPRDQIGLWVWNRGGPPRRLREETTPARPHVILGQNGEVVQIDEVGAIQIHRNDRPDLTLPAPSAFVGSTFTRFRPNGDLWVGGSNGLHLCRLTSTRWEYIRPMAVRPASAVLELLRRRDGSLWVGTTDGIEIHTPDGGAQLLTSAGGYQLRVITGLAEDGDGAVWVTSGFSFTGALRFDGRSWRHFGAADGLDERLYHRIATDRSTGLWFLGLENGLSSERVQFHRSGVFRLEGSAFTMWGSDHEPLRRSVYGFAEAPDGSYWFATGRGLSRWSHGTWDLWTAREGLRSERVFTVAAAPDGCVWFGDQAHGLGVLQKGNIHYYTTADGLVNDGVWEVKAEPSGRVWATTRTGATSYYNGVWNSFTYASGLNHTALWPVLIEGSAISFGTVGGGVATVHVENDLSHLPEVRIDPPLIQGSRVRVHWQVNAWWGEQPQGGLESRFRLDDGPWSGWSTLREADFASVDRGYHVFTLQVKNQDGITPEKVTTVPFTLERSFFLRPLVLVVTALILVASGLLLWYVLRRYRRHRLELRLSEQTSLALLNASTDPSYLLDADGRILAMNHAAGTLPGVPSAGSTLFDLIPPALAASRRAAMEMVLSNRKPLRLEDQHDGKHFEHTIHPVLDASGKPTRIAFSSRDVSERRQLEDTLQSTVHFLRLILESSRSVGIISTDRQGVIHFWNTGATHILGFPPEDVVSKAKINELLPAGDEQGAVRFMALMTRVIGAGETVQESFSLQHADGRERMIRFTFSPEIEPSGLVQGMLLIGEDITEQERARRETDQAERQLRLLAFTLNCAKDSFVITDLHNMVLYINQAFIDTYGYTEDEIIGKDVMVIRSKRVAKELSERIRQGTRAAGWSGEIMNRRKNGEEFPVELWTSTVRNDHGEPVALVGVAREITERRRTEDQIKASLAEKEVLLKEIHHRVKNNLQIITSLLSLQSGKVESLEIQSLLRESQTRVKSMALVHEELYQSEDFSRVDFADYIRRLTTNLFHTYQTGPIPISLLVDVQELFLTVDTAIPCGLIINELVSNALKHAFRDREGGTVTIQLQSDGALYVLTVSDDGIGLPIGIDPETTESLGLQLVSTLTHQLGGSLAVVRDQGTRFEVQFVEQQQRRKD
jgi:PAS domain S-box-containing protein